MGTEVEGNGITQASMAGFRRIHQPERVPQEVELPCRHLADACIVLVHRQLQLAHDSAQVVRVCRAKALAHTAALPPKPAKAKCRQTGEIMLGAVVGANGHHRRPIAEMGSVRKSAPLGGTGGSNLSSSASESCPAVPYAAEETSRLLRLTNSADSEGSGSAPSPEPRLRAAQPSSRR